LEDLDAVVSYITAWHHNPDDDLNHFKFCVTINALILICWKNTAFHEKRMPFQYKTPDTNVYMDEEIH
jgi:hypothetical protein